MSRHVAFLRGVSPLNAKMPELKRCFESAGFTNVRTVLSSGNVVFDSRWNSESAIERRAEKAMGETLDRVFHTIVRSAAFLQDLISKDPFAKFDLPSEARRVVTFLRKAPSSSRKLPIELDGAKILAVHGREVLSAYVPSPRGPVFMALIEKTFGKDVTTRTWDTVRKCSVA
jgi:uncharacterized protein (DUF1697 family)